MFSGRPSVPLSVRPSVRLSVRPFSRYLQYLLTDFRQTFVTGASRDRDDLITFWGQKVKVQGHAIPAEAHSTRRCLRVQLFLVFMHVLLVPATAQHSLPFNGNVSVRHSVIIVWRTGGTIIIPVLCCIL